MVKKLNATEFEAAVSSGVAVVDFSATWCGPCKMLAPVLEEVSDEMDGQANFFNVDVDECQNLAVSYGIMNIPAVVVFKDGKKQEMSVGFKPKESMSELVKKYV